MPGVRDQLRLPVAGGGEGGSHRVEGAGQPGDLVLALDRDAECEVLGAGDMLDGLGELVDGAQAGAGDPQPGGARADDTDAGDGEEDERQLVEGVGDLFHGQGHGYGDPGLTSRTVNGRGVDAHLGAVLRLGGVHRVGPHPGGYSPVGELHRDRGLLRLGAGRRTRRQHQLERVGRRQDPDPVRLGAGPRENVDVGPTGTDLLQARVELLDQPVPRGQPAGQGHRRHRDRHGGRDQHRQPGAQRQGADPVQRARHPSPPCGPQRVPDAPHRVHEPRFTARFRLAAQVHHVHVQGVGARFEVEAPDRLQDLLAGQHLPRMGQEHLQQGEFGPGQLDAARTAGDLAGGEVHPQIGEGQHIVVGDVAARRGRVRATAQQGPDAGEELVQFEGLDQIVVGAGCRAR